MADVSIDATVSTSTARGMRSVVFTTPLIGYWFYIDSNGAFVYSKTTDGGATWGAAVTINSNTDIVSFDVWFDQWTPGDNGTLIHTWYFSVTGTNPDTVLWRTLDTSSDTLGTQRSAFVGASAVAGRGAFCSGTKTKSGYLYVAFDIDAGAEKGLVRSTDGGATWSTNLSATFILASGDICLCFPGNLDGSTGDDNDLYTVYHNATADDLTERGWDSSAASIATPGSALDTNTIENTTDLTGQRGYDAAIRHSDGHIIVVSFTERDTITADCKVWDVIVIGARTAKTNITTDIDDIYYPVVFIDQNTNRIYVAYNGKKDGSEVLGTTTKIYYVYSDDGGTTWSAEQPYQEGATAAAFQVWAPLSGPRFYVGWRVGTTLVGNAVNSVDITAAPSVPLPSLITQPPTPARRYQ
jgi:hypothetical protein